MVETYCSAMISAPLLGPMMAVTLAICLSYLHLEPFRHREKVRAYARDRHDLLKSVMEGREQSTSWRRICELAETASPTFGEPEHNSPRRISEKFYSWVFMRPNDTRVATAGAFLSPAFLIYWTGYLTGHMGAMGSCSFMAGFLSFTYYLLVAGIIFIIVAASSGPRIVQEVRRQIDRYEDEITALAGPELQEKARRATVDTSRSAG